MKPDLWRLWVDAAGESATNTFTCALIKHTHLEDDGSVWLELASLSERLGEHRMSGAETGAAHFLTQILKDAPV